VDGECHQLFSYTWCQRWFIGILYIYIILCFVFFWTGYNCI
jgi:hypothetical protein